MTTALNSQEQDLVALPPRNITHSSVSTFHDCTKAFDYSYNRSIYSTSYPAALTMGTATHEGTEPFKRGEGMDAGLLGAEAAFEHQLELFSRGFARRFCDEFVHRLRQTSRRESVHHRRRVLAKSHQANEAEQRRRTMVEQKMSELLYGVRIKEKRLCPRIRKVDRHHGQGYEFGAVALEVEGVRDLFRQRKQAARADFVSAALQDLTGPRHSTHVAILLEDDDRMALLREHRSCGEPLRSCGQ